MTLVKDSSALSSMFSEEELNFDVKDESTIEKVVENYLWKSEDDFIKDIKASDLLLESLRENLDGDSNLSPERFIGIVVGQDMYKALLSIAFSSLLVLLRVLRIVEL